ncbi:hypothetical protein FSP39_012426 [Pinctada imbricata]|uniref:G-protein coupled receptors family 1 profile domain-containing protein n=1 Tax=Pinctada imbricata TaxID=66713 RepID=A0AA88XSQ3_PINIB|nr:hypothetical protein FSP39_012426 [Pinctada imbricata]
MEDNVTSDNVSSEAPACHVWLKDALPNLYNATLDQVNSQLVRRNIGGILLLSALIIVGLIGNVHVMWIYLRQFKTSNYRVYVLWLAILDILNCTVVAPMVISYLFFPVQFPSLLYCKLFRFVLYVMAISSTSSLIAIAIDRYRKVCNPLGKQFSIKKAKFLCVLSLCVGIGMSWPAPIMYGMSHAPTGVPGLEGYRCFTEDYFKTTYYQTIFNAILGLYFIVVSSTLVFVYIRIGKHIKTHQKFQNNIRKMSVRNPEELKAVTNAGSNKSTVTLCVVTIAYILSALPHHILATLIFLKKDFDCSLSLVSAQLYYTFIWSYFVNSVVNPFIYGIRDKKFRFAVKRLYRKTNESPAPPVTTVAY